MKLIREIIWISLLLSASAWATTPNNRYTDQIMTTTGGAILSVPSVGTTLISDTDTVSLTNKTLSSTTDVLGGVTMTLGSDATGDVYYRNSSGVLTRLAATTNGFVLTLSSGLPAWAAASGGGTWTQEDVLGCNGTATSFTLANTPTANFAVSLYLDGAILRQGAGKSYTLSGSSITLTSACASGQSLYAVYTH
jgi:hypothetical protein